MMGLQAFAEWDTSTKVPVDGLYYYLDESTHQAQVTSMPSTNYTGAIEIPSSFIYNETSYSVTSIDNFAFKESFELTSVTIPNSVTSIGSYAFQKCYELTSVTIPNSVTSIGKHAFGECNGLISIIVESENTVYDSRNNCNAIIETASNTLKYGCKNTTIPNNVTSIDSYAFFGYSDLTTVTIPNSVTSIGWGAFAECSGLTFINIPNSVTNIGNKAFNHCASLTSITIPNSVTSIGDNTFADCSGLTSVTIGNGVMSIGSYAFNRCINLTSITIPNSVTSIGEQAFFGCISFTSITIPCNVTNISKGAFSGCSSLTSVTLNSNDIVSMTYNSYTNIKSFFGNQVTKYVIGNEVTSIGGSAFFGCSDLTTVTIPNSVTNIGNKAFNGCTSLTSVTALNPTPVTITDNVFTYRKNATLYVPKGSKSAYQAADYWKEFKEIVEIDVTGIDQICFQENGNDEQGINEEGAVWFTIDGKQVDKPKKGINIIRMSDGTTKKVVAK